MRVGRTGFTITGFFMRIAAIASLAASLLATAACTSSNMDALDIAKPSGEVVSSISASPQLTPPADVSALIAANESNPFPPAMTAAEPTMPETAAPEPVQVREPETQVAMAIAPENPAPRVDHRGRQTIYAQKFRDAKPINFGRAHPKHFDVHGVDVSRWQGKIDWKTLRSQGANFAFIKATDGGDHIDPMFRTNWEGAKAAGVPRGAYHFFYWCRVGEDQAKWFIRNVPKEKGALPPVIDAEWNHDSKSCKRKPSPATVRKKMKVFMDMVEAHYGKKPIIYTAPDFYEDNLRGHFKEYDFWLRSVAAYPKERYPEREFLFWQYSGTGLSKGVSTKIDLNVFNGSEKSWHKWLASAAR